MAAASDRKPSNHPSRQVTCWTAKSSAHGNGIKGTCLPTCRRLFMAELPQHSRAACDASLVLYNPPRGTNSSSSSSCTRHRHIEMCRLSLLDPGRRVLHFFQQAAHCGCGWVHAAVHNSRGIPWWLVWTIFWTPPNPDTPQQQRYACTEQHLRHKFLITRHITGASCGVVSSTGAGSTGRQLQQLHYSHHAQSTPTQDMTRGSHPDGCNQWSITASPLWCAAAKTPHETPGTPAYVAAVGQV